MKYVDSRRKVLYLLFGVLPSLILLPIPLLFIQEPGDPFFFLALLPVGGCLGLCLAFFCPPSHENARLSTLVALVLASGCLVAGSVALGLIRGLFHGPLRVSDIFMLFVSGSPLLVAAHYFTSLASSVWKKRRVA